MQMAFVSFVALSAGLSSIVGCRGADTSAASEGSSSTDASTGEGTGASTEESTGTSTGESPITTGASETTAASADTGASSDESGGSSTGATNTAPIATGDELHTAVDQVLMASAEQGLLANDVDVDADVLTVIAFDAMSAAGGAVVVSPDGAVSYTPPAGFVGIDTFEYTISDGLAEDTAVVTIQASITVVVFAGSAEYHAAGLSVANAGDVNGDGLTDVIMGAPYSAGLDDTGGRAYVVFGSPTPEGGVLSDVGDGIAGFVMNGGDYDAAGLDVSGVGDLNDDGLADVMVGAPYGRNWDEYRGSAYIVYGKPDGTPVALDDVAQGIGGFALTGELENDLAGDVVASGGDFNGDGREDLLVGAAYASENSRHGTAYVIFGAEAHQSLELATISAGVGGFALHGVAATDHLGVAMATLGDLNSDGLDDLVIGAYGVESLNRSNNGRCYVVFGGADAPAIDVAGFAETDAGFAIEGAASDDFSCSAASGPGDVNGDGVPDVLLGAFSSGTTGSLAGRAYVVFGKADTDEVDLLSVEMGVGGFALDAESPNDLVGYQVSGAGDVDGDGLADVLVSSRFTGPGGDTTARAYLVYGKEDTTNVDLSAVAMGTGGYAIDIESDTSDFGPRVSGAGDFNGDGRADIIIGSGTASPNDVYAAGRVEIRLGTAR